MDIIAMARELGKAIQQDERYKRIDAAKKANDADSVLQDLIDPLFCLGVQLVKVLTIQFVLFRRKQSKQQSKATAERE